ncbi:hypothetical protein J3R83DRAFT_10462 [Lanmaoa asiatica]|nr:hypothetical protein J3R83DRAFT_10462 [Lanmaoa asiatica]
METTPVRCHRCWKIANGFYKPNVRGSAQEPDSCTDSEDDEAVDAKTNSVRLAPDSIHASPSIASPSIPPSPLHSATSFQDTQIARDTPSTLTQLSTRDSPTYKPIPPALQLNDGYPIELVSPIRDDILTQRGLVVPSVAMTAPESPMSIQTAKPAPVRGNTVSSAVTQTSIRTEYSSKISLSALSDTHRHHVFRSGDSNTESKNSEGESETLLLVYSDVSSAGSSNTSQDHLVQPSPTLDTRSTDRPQSSGVPRSRQFLLRPAYKRYLISMPPSILVVHLKHFQQLSKTPVVSFSTGFKKLDDYISFPEYLDLAPYLAPRREDYFESKVAVTRGRVRRPAPCMYRLYAVMVHIGNMVRVACSVDWVLRGRSCGVTLRECGVTQRQPSTAVFDAQGEQKLLDEKGKPQSLPAKESRVNNITIVKAHIRYTRKPRTKPTTPGRCGKPSLS